MKRKILDTYVLHSTARIRQLLTLLVLLLASTTVFAQFPRQVSFTTNAASGFRVGGNAVLTGTSTTSTDGVLRLTSNNTHEAGFAIDDFSFPAPSGFSISFEFFSYGGTGADGFSVFLIDADKTSSTNFTSGASGGALGYAQRNITPINKGVPNGYIGIGLDEFGNFSSGTEGRVGGPGVVPDAVVIRGSGSGQDAASTTDYPYLAGNGRLPFSLDVNSTERVTDPQNPNYRRAYIDVVPQPDGTYKIRVQIQHGTAIQTAIENVTVPKPPANLRIGFAGSTGGSTNYHEIRNLAVLQSPVAMDDRAGTRYDQPVSFSVIANDLFQYSTYKPGGVDLDPSTDGIQSTYTVAGKGTFIVSTEGQVTFTPSGTYAGIVTIPYTVQDLIGSKTSPAYQSNPANITVVVSGADVATTISGPTAANPGASVTYTVSTLNIGRETALNVVPTLQLSTSATNIVLPDGATRSASNLITFPAIASLESSAAPMTYAVTFTLPTSGSITGTTNFTATTPDLNLGNNSSALTTNTVGISNVASGCAAPGQDGAVTLTSTAQPNTYYPGLSVAADKKSIKLGQVRNTAGTPITAGDLLLVMQMQGADINTTSGDATYGTDIISATGHTAGQYEYAIATGPVAVDGTLPLQAALQNTYTNQDYTTATGGQRRFQVIRVPQYASLTINGTVTGLSWDGTTGGVLVVDVAGETKFATNAVLDMNGRGFRGGAGKRYLGNASYTKTDYYNVAVAGTDGAHGSKGEGFAGAPRFTNDGLDNGVEGYVNGSVGAGAPGNAGGGGTDAAAANGNSSNAGGGGGGNGGNGGSGGKYGSILGLGQTLSLDGIGGQFGRAASLASSSRLYLGGGGGAGSTNATDPSTSRGANGGGIIILRTGTVSGTGTIKADGNAGASGYNGGGGGGAGGTVVINTQVATSLSNITVSTVGGNGGKVSDPNPLVALLSYKGGGGGGGGGRIYANNTLNAATSAAGGSLGSGVNVGTNGVVGVSGTVQAATTTSIPTGISSNFSCLPMLTASLTTSTPQLSRSSTGVKPAIYTITVTNSGGQANNVSAMVTMGNGTSRTTGGSATGTANGLIKYKAGSAVVKLTSANGTVTELLAVAGRGQAVSDRYTQPTADSSTPTFSNITMPAGSTLTITYVADVASLAVNNTPYQSGVQVSYPDPTRTSDANWATPGTMYTAMPSTAVPGSNYVSTSSAAEDIIIAQPLPVELKQFNVAAVRQDAQLTWSTASEKNNDRFEVERSLDGEVFARIGTVKGIGYSTQTQTYHYFDANVARLSAGHPLYYRLHQVDTDGTDTYSPVRVIRFEAALETTVSVYPNPTQAQATLELTSLPAGNYQVRILDMTGRVLREQTLTGQQQHQLSVAELPMGTYLVQVRGANTSVTLPLLRN
ncbi:T9SS type A sorting domain-containing protein [Hymenobacter defluvii]|uniref:T9SS type A sorting domain-containing protein n=1 Tax=Hymenobacter defluvii TaxID=2054411 RepID=A0ABS3T6L2_9BACT|nr:T9SS type A sorting domain-containing protein [Hymenobacter defluvii]MBO3269290.1 T9SS type A sorting domain-containing protein [Hymenobacter defluvii]